MSIFTDFFNTLGDENLTIVTSVTIVTILILGAFSACNVEANNRLKHDLNVAKEVAKICEKNPDSCDSALETIGKKIIRVNGQ